MGNWQTFDSSFNGVQIGLHFCQVSVGKLSAVARSSEVGEELYNYLIEKRTGSIYSTETSLL